MATPTLLHQSLVRPNLLGGAEADLVGYNALAAFTLIFGLQTKLSVMFGLFLAIGVQWGLVQLAIKDPQWYAVYKRHAKYQPYYPSRAHPAARTGLIKDWVL